MSCRTGPCCSISYKRMEDKDVVQDRPLFNEDVPVIQASCINALGSTYDSTLKGCGLDDCVLPLFKQCRSLEGGLETTEHVLS